MRILGSLILALLLTGCATTSEINILDESSFKSSFSIDQIEVENSTGQEFDIDIENMLTESLTVELDAQELSNRNGKPYSLSVAIIQYSKGNAFGRWLMPGVGKTILSVEANIIDDQGVTIAESQATRSIGAGGGYTIGAWKQVFADVAQSLILDLVSAK